MTLFDIKEKVSARLEKRKQIISIDDLTKSARVRIPKPLKSIFLKEAINIIAEIKKASPSEGDISPQAIPTEVAKSYLKNGARALSVLTEIDFFKGRLEYISQIKIAAPDSFVLMKDFIFDEYQIIEGLNAGADAILLIVAMLEKDQFKNLFQKAKAWGLHTLVEVHSEEEMKVALSVNANLIGVNNRNLKTMKIDLNMSENLAYFSNQTDILISESGLSTGHQLKRLSEVGYRGFLMGTEFMKAKDPGLKLSQILAEAK